MNYYGCELWNYNNRYIVAIYISWRKGMGELFRLPYRTPNYLVSIMVERISVKLNIPHIRKIGTTATNNSMNLDYEYIHINIHEIL